MGLTPQDIRDKQFGKAFRGYNEAEVDEFLDEAARQLEHLARDNSALRDQLEQLSAKVEQYQRLEDTLHNTLVVAQQAAEEIKASARREAEVIVEEARSRAGRIVREAEARAEDARRRVEELIRQARLFQAQIKSLLASQLDLLDIAGPQLEQAAGQVAAALAEGDAGHTDGAGNGVPGLDGAPGPGGGDWTPGA